MTTQKLAGSGMYRANQQMPYLLPATIVVVHIPPTSAHNLVMKRSVRRLKKLARRPPMMVVEDEEVEEVLVIAVAVVVAEINEAVGMVLVTQQRKLIR